MAHVQELPDAVKQQQQRCFFNLLLLMIMLIIFNFYYLELLYSTLVSIGHKHTKKTCVSKKNMKLQRQKMFQQISTVEMTYL